MHAEYEEQTHIFRYAYSAEVPPEWDADFLLYLTNQKLYLLLHVATGKQEQAVLAWLQECLHTSGLVTAEFEEL